MKKEIDNTFIDIRNAFRLLSRYQEIVLNIINYIREQTPFTDMWGSKSCFSNEIKPRQSPDGEYAKLDLRKERNICGLDFLYGHFFEYYFSYIEKNEHKIEMSIFQISDDGYFISNKSIKHIMDVSSYESSEYSHSYIVLNVSVYSLKDNADIWLRNPEYPDDDYKSFLIRFLSSSKDFIVTQQGENYTVLKKYEMQRFASQTEADKVITDFAELVKTSTGVEFFKDKFYKRNYV